MNVSSYKNSELKTGLWLSELTHIYDAALKAGFHITIASPSGGNVPLDPGSLKPLMLDKLSKSYLKNTSFLEQLRNSESLSETSTKKFDLIYLASGHGTMYDFPDNPIIQSIIKTHYEKGEIVAAICHGVCGLLNVKDSAKTYLIRGKKLTGFNWFEESLANRRKQVPFNLEAALKERGAEYKKAFFPMTSHVIKDGNLITAQNPFSSKEAAKVIMDALTDKTL